MSRKTSNPDAEADQSGLDYRWHLARNRNEIETTEFEFALMRTVEGFMRWQSECLASVCSLTATGQENALLHIIRMNERPKSVKDLARLTNRDDIPNLQYSLRKLIGAGLVERKGSGRSGVTYEVTAEGMRVTDEYAAVRQRLLIAAIADVPGLAGKLDDAARTLSLLSGIYEEVARVAATHRRA